MNSCRWRRSTVDRYRRQFDLNVLGLVLATQEAAKLIGPEGGSVLNIRRTQDLIHKSLWPSMLSQGLFGGRGLVKKGQMA